MENNPIKIKRKSSGEVLGIAGGNYRIILTGEETNGNHAVIEMIVPPGGGPPPHAHPNFQEMFYVVEGQFEFKTETASELITEGGFVNIPLAGAIHCFINKSEKAGKLLCTVVPAGLDAYFKELGQPVKMGQFLPPPALTTERLAFMKEMDKKYGQTIYPSDFLDTILD